jgi:hypothetical protein
MGKSCFNKSAFLFAVILSLFFPIFVNSAKAGECVQTIRNPAPAGEVLNYGASRPNCNRNPDGSGGDPRVHRGVDIMLEMCLPVQPQAGCTVMMNGNSPIAKTGGYGLYARFNCGPRVEVRYAHLNTWSGGMAINGRSGAARSTPPHIHYEVLVDSVKVDPKCVWGTHPTPSDCGIANGGKITGTQPADMCDSSVLEALKANAYGRYTDRLGCMKSGMAHKEGVDPRSISPGPYEVDLPECEDYEGSHDGHHEHDDVTDDLEDNPIPVYDPPGPTPEVVPTPLPPDVPGEPEGDPDLVLTPEESPEKLSGCAADTWTAMVNQAVMQTRREDILNKRFIVKPDSVLDYSCYSEKVKSVAKNAGPIFSETTRWDNLNVDVIGGNVTIKLKEVNDEEPWEAENELSLETDYKQSSGSTINYTVFDSTSLDMALDRVVGYTAVEYFPGNFTQGYLSDTAPVSGASPENCNVMSAVWQAAKCKNFDGSDVFYTFDDLTSTEPRQFPVSIPCF